MSKGQIMMPLLTLIAAMLLSPHAQAPQKPKFEFDFSESGSNVEVRGPNFRAIAQRANWNAETGKTHLNWERQRTRSVGTLKDTRSWRSHQSGENRLRSIEWIIRNTRISRAGAQRLAIACCHFLNGLLLSLPLPWHVWHFSWPEPPQVEQFRVGPGFIPDSNEMLEPLPKQPVHRIVPAPLQRKHSYSVKTDFFGATETAQHKCAEHREESASRHGLGLPRGMMFHPNLARNRCGRGEMTVNSSGTSASEHECQHAPAK